MALILHIINIALKLAQYVNNCLDLIIDNMYPKVSAITREFVLFELKERNLKKLK